MRVKRDTAVTRNLRTNLNWLVRPAQWGRSGTFLRSFSKDKVSHCTPGINKAFYASQNHPSLQWVIQINMQEFAQTATALLHQVCVPYSPGRHNPRVSGGKSIHQRLGASGMWCQPQFPSFILSLCLCSLLPIPSPPLFLRHSWDWKDSGATQSMFSAPFKDCHSSHCL